MLDWPTIIAGTAVGGGALVGTSRLLLSVGGKLSRIETTLDDHSRRLSAIEEKVLPLNGEIQETHDIVREIYAKLHNGDAGAYAKRKR